MKTYTYAVFDERGRAERAVHALDEKFAKRKIDVVLQDPHADERVREIPVKTRTSVGTGIAVGAASGIIVATMVSVGSGLVSTDPVWAATGGFLFGAFVGGVVGVLGGLGHWKSSPELPAEVSDDAQILVGVESRAEKVPDAHQAFADVGATNVGVLADRAERPFARAS